MSVIWWRGTAMHRGGNILKNWGAHTKDDALYVSVADWSEHQTELAGGKWRAHLATRSNRVRDDKLIVACWGSTPEEAMAKVEQFVNPAMLGSLGEAPARALDGEGVR